MADNPYQSNDSDSQADDAFSALSPDSDADDQSDDQAEQEAAEQKRKEELVEKAKLCFAKAEEAESENRKLALEDLEFRAGKQWPANIQAERLQDARPCLVINRTHQLVQQVVNDQRQNRPSIKVHPEDHQADEETAEIIQGLIRRIEYSSNAEVAYDTAHEGAVTGGFGYFRILTQYESPDSFNQELVIKRIRNPLSVYMDPYSQELDGSDAKCAFIVEEISKDDYKSAYPESELAKNEQWSSLGDDSPDWIKSDGARVAEYFYIEQVDKTVHLLSTGQAVFEEDLDSHAQAAASSNFPLSIVKSRQTKVPVVKWAKLNGLEILEEGEWLTEHIPIIPVYGQEIYINGKRILESLVRHVKDPQRMLNFWKSSEAETIALAPRAPFIGAEGQFEGHPEWETANRRNHAYLEYKATDIKGQLAPPPQRQAFEPAIQGITAASMQAADDIKAVSGVFDAGTGNVGPEVSGIAIQRRGNQVQNANFHFSDNLKHSLKHAGRILVDAIPKVYDTERVVQILGDDGSKKTVTVNASQSQDKGKNGKPLLYNLKQGRYGVTVDTGPSYASKRQEGADYMMQFSQSMPQVAQYCADLIAHNMDFPGAQEMADRLKKLLPPALQDDGKQPLPPQAQAQMAQMQKMIQDLSQHLNETTKIIETKKLDLESREKIEILKLQTNAEIEMAKLGSKEDMALLEAKLTEMEHRLTLLNMNAPIGAPNDFDPNHADGGNYAGVGHIGSGPTGGPDNPQSPGQPVEGNP